MSKKGELKREIADLEDELEALEQKRMRSLAALMTAVVKHTEPDRADLDFFQTFTDLIDASRSRLRQMKKELEELNNK
ncbi:MAG: hypothetical protein HDT28_05630 [Clostridiales bacterium]|nr:hypothetical protein [Clostridiales bacterium]